MVTWGTIQQFLLLSSKYWRWRTTLNCEMLSSPDTLRVLLATHWICLSGLEHSLNIHGFNPISPYLIIEVLDTWEKFLQPSGYKRVISNFAFTFDGINIFGCFLNVMTLFKLVEHKFSESDYAAYLPMTLMAFKFMCEEMAFKFSVKKCTMCEPTNYRDTINDSW